MVNQPFGILDTTLRDGEQAPGISLTMDEKLQIAKQLDILGVDIIEAGSAIVSKEERKSIKAIANEGLSSEIASFSRLSKEEIDIALDCGVNAITLVAPVSDTHIRKKLRMDRGLLRNRTIEMVEYAKDHGLKVEVDAEDASRADFDFVKSLFSSLPSDRICFCDTVGVLFPERTEQIFKSLSDLPVSVHCHDDFGLATANTITALMNGAKFAHVTINGIGERTGNASLEEVVMALETHYGAKTKIVKEKLYETSRLVKNLTKMPVAPNKPLVGDNAFTHESGMHVHGTLADPTLYEPFDPSKIGRKRRIAFGKHTGKSSVKMALDDLKIEANEEQIRTILAKVKELGDKGKLVTDADFQAIVDETLLIAGKEKLKLIDLSVVSGKNVYPTASIRLKIDDEDFIESAVGIGPVDAAINALRKSMKGMEDLQLEEYHVDAITGGTDALVNVTVKMSRGDKMMTASGVSEDIVMASVHAVTNAANRLYR